MQWLHNSEREELRHLNNEISDHYNKDINFSHLAVRWEQAVMACRRGYEKGLEEYTADISVRLVLEDIIEAASKKLREKLSHKIAAIDEIFYEVTSELPADLLDVDPRKEPFKFKLYSRVPKRPGPLLKADLQEIGFSGGK